jgi:hypothetical protein
LFPQGENQKKKSEGMTFRQFQLVEHIITGRCGRISQVGDGDYVLVSFGSGEDQLLPKDELSRKSETTVRNMTRTALGDYFSRSKHPDKQQKHDNDSIYIEGLFYFQKRMKFFRNNIFPLDSLTDENE